jgi:hypothetical protein
VLRAQQHRVTDALSPALEAVKAYALLAEASEHPHASELRDASALAIAILDTLDHDGKRESPGTQSITSSP